MSDTAAPIWLEVSVSAALGFGLACILHYSWRSYDVMKQLEELKSGTDVEEVNGVVLKKDHHTTEIKAKEDVNDEGAKTVHHYKISYSFQSGSKDIRVMDCDVDGTTWSNHKQGGPIEVVYFRGGLQSCQIKMNIDTQGPSLFIIVIGTVFAILFYSFATYIAGSILTCESTVGKTCVANRTPWAFFIGFFLSFCLGMVLAYKNHIDRKKNHMDYKFMVPITAFSSIFDGQVIVLDRGSDYNPPTL